MTLTTKEIIFSVFFILAVLVPLTTFAFGGKAFGGRITTIKTPPDFCGLNLASPFSMTSVTGMPSVVPWSASFGKVNVGQIIPNTWILGMTSPFPGKCVSSASGFMYPTRNTNFYGTSAPDLGLPI